MGLHSKTVVFPGVAAILAWVMAICGTKRDRIACRAPCLDLAGTMLARQWGEMMFFFCSRRCRSGIGKNARRPVSRVLSRPLRARDDHSSGTSVAGRLARPTRAAAAETRLAGAGPEGPVGRPPLCGLAPGGVCHAAAVAGGAVRSYRTLSPLPAASEDGRRRSALCGTFPGVAPAGRYPAPCFRGARTFLPPARGPESGHPAVWRLLAKRSRARRQPRRFTIPCRRAAVSPSARPSIRAGRKWRWKA